MRLTIAAFANYGEIKTVRPDTAGYLTPARSLVADGTYEGTRRPPGLPVLAAAVFKSGGGEKVLSFVLAMISAFAVLAVARAGFLYGGHQAALIAGTLYALNPTALGNAPLLLKKVLDLPEFSSWQIGNLDITIIAQKPKLAPFREAMQKRLAEVCQLPVDAVSVKFTTTEKLGFTGRGEGIAASAVVLLGKKDGCQ